MLGCNENDLELHWVEVRDEHGAHMEAHWTCPDAAPTPLHTQAPHAA